MSDLPKQYRAVVLEKAQAPWTVKNVDLQQPKEGEILVKTEASGICASDVGVQQGHFGPMAAFPLIPGHEVLGEKMRAILVALLRRAGQAE